MSSYNNDPFTRPTVASPYTLPDAWPTNFVRDPQNFSSPESSTRVVVLGSGMPLPNPYRQGPAFALIVNDTPYLVDAGEGIWRSLARAALVNGDEIARGLSPDKLKRLFVTHLHEDHTVGIPSLLLNPFKLSIPTPKLIYGPKGTAEMVEHIVQAWKIDIASELADGSDPEGGRAEGFDFDFERSGLVFEDDNVRIEAFRTIHGRLENTFAFRCTTEDRVVVFAGDGGPYHHNIVEAAQGADVLVGEAVTERNLIHAPWGGETLEEKRDEIFRFHFSPSVLARIGNEADVGMIVLAHEQNYNSGDDFEPLGLLNEVVDAGFDRPIHSSMDADVY